MVFLAAHPIVDVVLGLENNSAIGSPFSTVPNTPRVAVYAE